MVVAIQNMKPVRGIERDWEKQLGQKRFAQLRSLLLELNDLA
jgi:hypothetical protein